MRYRQILAEMIWEDRFEAAKVARRYPGAWIHFSHMPKLGINPSKQHHDPPGIYFYPTNWLFSEAASLSQFATEYEYFFIVQFKRSARVINLSRMTMNSVTRIAQANGWLDELQAVMRDPTLLDNARQPMAKRLLKRPGGLFYATLDYLANVKHRPWLGMLRGCDGLFDPGRGFIAGAEAAQAVMFGRQHVTVLAQGANTDHQDRQYADILRQIATELGGQFSYRNKLPVAEFTNAGRPFRITLNLGNFILELAYYQRGFWTVHQQRYTSYEGGDRENHYQSLKYYAEKTAAVAEPAPAAPAYWNGDSVARLLRMIRPTVTMYQRVEDDGLHVWVPIDRFGHFYPHLRAVIDRDGGLNITASIEEVDHPIEMRDGQVIELPEQRVLCQASGKFATQPIAPIANQMLDELARQLWERLPNPTGLLSKRGGWLCGFAFGDRFQKLAA